jgi:carboxymethylenebutenolidase
MSTITAATPDGAMGIHVAEPTVPNGCALVVIQEAFGLTDHIASVTGRYAAEGYLAVAPHLFHRSGDPVIDYGDLPAAMSVMSAVTRQGLDDDLTATLAVVSERGIAPARTGIVGFCLGGTVAIYAATREGFGAAVAFYGGGILEGRLGLPPLVELAPVVRAPVLGQYGAEDRGIPVEQTDALRTALAEAPVPTEVVVYQGAGHAFHRDGYAPSYHAPSAAAAWTRSLEWFARYLGEANA